MLPNVVLITKILIPVGLLMIGWLLLRKRVSGEVMLVLGALVIAFALVSNKISDLVPPLRDEVTLTALGEKCEEARKEEVFLAGYTIDGKEYLAGKDMELLGGKWFWKGETYCWRIESDERQPEGVTRSVTVGIPVGVDRTLNFEGDMWRGKVEISAAGQTWVSDTYAEEKQPVSVQIGASKESTLIWEQVRRLVMYAAVLLGMCSAAWILKRKAMKIRPTTWLRIAITFVAFAIMWHYAGIRPLWADDIATIHFVAEGESIRTVIERIWSECGYNPPLFYVLAYFWLRIAPYGTAWLKLPSMVFASVGIWFCGVAANRIRGERAAVMATMLSATSYYLFNYAAFTFRSYGLLFMLCPLLIIAYYKRLTEPGRVSSHVWYCVMHIALLYTNYICILITAAMWLYDCFLFYKKKIKLNCIYSYICAGVLFLPLVLAKLTSIVSLHDEFWPVAPNLETLRSQIDVIFTNQKYLIIVFITAIAVMLYSQQRAKERERELLSPICVDMSSMLAFWAVFVVGADYIYSCYINPSGSIFVRRYFVSVLAPAIIVTSVGLDMVTDIICAGQGGVRERAVAVLAALCCLIPTGAKQLDELNRNPGTTYEPYEQAIDWIYEEVNYLWPNSLIDMSPYQYQGGLYYYTTRDGRRDNLNYGSLTESNWEEYDVVFVAPLHTEVPPNTVEILNEHFTVVEQNKDLNVTVYARKAE